MTIRAVILDIGGVLEVNPPTGWQGRWAAELDLEPAEIVQRLDATFAAGSTGAITLAAAERQIAARLHLGSATLAAFMDDLWEEYLGRLNLDLAQYFAALRPRYRTGVLSNSFVGAREREQARYGFGDLCDAIVYSHEEGRLKPDPLFYRLVCERLGVLPEESVLIDDVPAWVDGARAIGMKAVRFIDNDQAIGELEALLNPGE